MADAEFIAKYESILSDDEMYLIHMRVMETLEQLGIMVEEEASLKVWNRTEPK